MVAMLPSFSAIDFETANSSPASACAVGIARVRDGRLVWRDSWRIRPPAGHDHFEAFNVRLHGVRAEDVEDAPDWGEQLPRLLDAIGDDVLAAHNANFDLGVLAATSLATGTALPTLHSICSLRLARRVYELPSYRLPLAAAAAGFAGLEHHDPQSDAEACAAIVVDAARRTSSSDLQSLAAATGVQLGRLALGDGPRVTRLIANATF